MTIELDLSLSGARLRAAIFQGALVRDAGSPLVSALADRARSLLESAFDGRSPPDAHLAMDNDRWLARVSAARDAIGRDEALRALCQSLAERWGFTRGETLLDRPRLRANRPGLAAIPAAAPALYAHRDTWYANPRTQINAWTALYDAPDESGFALWPALLSAPVANDSERFSYEAFIARAGWQRRDPPPDQCYPRALEAPSVSRVVVAPSYGTLVLFAAAHLHQTLAHDGAQTRFSVDFRLVDRSDGDRGAPSVDDRSTGDASTDYARW